MYAEKWKVLEIFSLKKKETCWVGVLSASILKGLPWGAEKSQFSDTGEERNQTNGWKLQRPILAFSIIKNFINAIYRFIIIVFYISECSFSWKCQQNRARIGSRVGEPLRMADFWVCPLCLSALFAHSPLDPTVCSWGSGPLVCGDRKTASLISSWVEMSRSASWRLSQLPSIAMTGLK